MNSIGGYFELEVPLGEEYHNNAIRLNTGRNAFEYLLRAKHYYKVYLPYYTCDVMLEPIKKLNIDYQFYSIDNQFRPVFDFSIVEDNAVFVYTNYFGVCNTTVKEISMNCKNLIVDNSQSFYSESTQGIDTFYSARKFFGVPDGAYLYTDKYLGQSLESDSSYQRFTHLLGRIDIGAQEFYQEFKDNDKGLSNQPIKQMSKLTHSLLCGIDYQRIAKIRRENFDFLHSKLYDTNEFKLNIETAAVPLIYPYLVSNGEQLKKLLIQNGVFVPTFWPNVFDWVTNGFEEYIAKNLVCLPIDQRYRLIEMEFITHQITNKP